MSAIGKGDWVECVDARPRPTSGPDNRRSLARLRVGGLYVVEWVGLSRSGAPCLRLRGIKHLHPSVDGFKVERFRPIYRPDADLIESLKAPPISAPQRITEAA